MTAQNVDKRIKIESVAMWTFDLSVWLLNWKTEKEAGMIWIFVFPSQRKMQDFFVVEWNFTFNLDKILNFHGHARKAREDPLQDILSCVDNAERWDVLLSRPATVSLGQEITWSGTGSVEGIETFPIVFLVTFQEIRVSIFFSQKGELNPSFLLPEWVLKSQDNKCKQIIWSKATLYYFLAKIFQQIPLKFMKSCRSVNDQQWNNK